MDMKIVEAVLSLNGSREIALEILLSLVKLEIIGKQMFLRKAIHYLLLVFF